MTTRLWKAGPFVLCLLFCNQVKAEEYTIWGVGTQSCGRWTEMHSAQTADNLTDMQDSWLAGFISGFSAYAFTPSRTYSVDFSALQASLTNYCSAHLLDPIATAAQMLAAQLDVHEYK
jgi:hypothetical protein